MANHVHPAIYRGYPPYMSPSRPSGSSVVETTREKALAGQVMEAEGILSSVANVGMMTENPLMKYSVMNWLIVTANMNPYSSYADLKTSGLCRPRRSIRFASDSSVSSGPSGVDFFISTVLSFARATEVEL